MQTFYIYGEREVEREYIYGVWILVNAHVFITTNTVNSVTTEN